MRQVLSLIFIVLGTFIGAGCISGKETVVYFTNYTQYFLMCVIASVAITIIFIFYLNFGKRYNIDNFSSYSRVLFPKNSGFINMLFIICMLCMIGNMFAGLNIILYSIVPSRIVINLFLILSICMVVSHDIKGIENLNLVVMPFIILFIFIISISSIDVATIHNTMQGYDFSLFKVIIYIFLNILDISILLCQISPMYSKRVCVISSIISGAFILLIGVTQSLAFLSHNILNYDFPMLEISKYFNSSVLYYVVSIFAMFTTLISAVYLVYSYIKQYFNKYLSILIISLVGIAISMLGFEFIISNVYILLGILGLVLFLRSVYIYYF